MQSRRAFPARTGEAHGGPRLLWRVAERLWLRRDGQRGIRPDDAGTGTRRLGRPQLCQRAVWTMHVSDLRIRQRRAETDVAASHAEGRKARLLWPDRARFWVQPGRHANPGEESRQRVLDQRRKDVDHL